MKKIFTWALCCFFSVSAMAIEPVDGVYQIGTAQDWAEFCTLHNEGTDQRLNAILTADVTVEGNFMVGINGGGKPYRGTFDGQGHKLTVNYDLDEERVAPFRRINGATIKNLIVEGSITTTSKLAAGLVGGLWQSGALIQNCVSYVTINDTNGGDATHGGICGSFEDVNGANTIENCAFLGAINAPNREGCGGIVGWTNNNANNNIIRNCLVSAHGFNVLRLSNNDIICRNNGNVENCYYFGSLDGYKNDKGAIQTNEAQAASGELCYLLNGRQSDAPAWYQIVGTDEMPMPFEKEGGIVYANGQLNCDGTPKEGVEVVYANTNASERDDHSWSEWGFCSVCNAMQEDFLTPDEDGFYPIATKMDYNWFMVRVNNLGNVRSNAKLTQDLDLNEYTFIPIGSDAARYAGTFDGQGHRIKNMVLDGTKKEQGFFSVLQGGAVIKNLIIDSSCTMEGTGGNNVAALVGCVNGSTFDETITIENVGNEMSFECSTTNNAGFVARDWSGNLRLVFNNCYNTGNITGGVENGAFTAWTPRVTLNNCWNTGRIEMTGGYDGSTSLARGNKPVFNNSYDLNADNGDNAGAPEGYTAEWLASGQLCYILNGKQSDEVAWYQKLGEEGDAQPYPFGTDIVYANGALQCDGITPKEGSELTFSNTEGNTVDDHQWNDWGFCGVCDTQQPDFLEPVDGTFFVADEKELNWVAVYINKVDHAANVTVTADIDFSELNVMIGDGDNDLAYKGIFDGQGHTIKVAYETSQKNSALFRYLNGATVKNLITTGTVKNEDSSCSGGIFAGSRGATVVENCVSYVTLTRESGGDATAGGIGAYMHDNGTVRHCAFYGVINTPLADGNGGILGYANGGEAVTIENCVVAAEFTVSGNTAAISRNKNNLSNVFFLKAEGVNEQGELITADQLASGEVAYKLNGQENGGETWFQILGTDEAPLPLFIEGGTIYITGTLACDGTPNDDAGYSNTFSEMTQDDHDFAEGLCTRCGQPKEDYLVAEEGFYALATPHDVVWFAAMVNRVDNTISGTLTADLDFDGVEFKGIGTEENPFAGTFDGQQHIISNLIIDLQEEESVAGFFNSATGGATIKRFTMDNTCFITANHFVGAFVGHVFGNGTLTLEELGNEADVTAWNQNAAGILGCNTSGDLHIDITNCYNTGLITSGRESGGISGWLGNGAVVTNSYNMGEIIGDNSESFARGNTTTAVNCFDPVSNWEGQITPSPIDDFTNGTIFALLDEAAPGIWHLSAEEGGHPVLYDSGFPVITPTGIAGDNVFSDNSVQSVEYFNLNGQQVSNARGQKVVIMRQGNKVKKVVR